jgi:hypothetical protein
MDEQAQPFFRRVWTGLPVLFPIVGLFQIALFCYNLIRFALDGVLGTAIAAGTCVELMLYALLWIAVCDRRRWAAIGYIVLTSVNLLLQFLAPVHSIWHQISDALFPFDALLCFFLLFFYKRFR